MADTDEEDEYSDDDLDALPSEEFLELQDEAVRSTQQQKPYSIPEELPVPGKPAANSWNVALHELNRNVITPQVQNRPVQPSSDYGDLDEEVLDADLLEAPESPLIERPRFHVVQRALGESTQREQWRQDRFSVPPRSKHIQPNSAPPGAPVAIGVPLRPHDGNDEEEMLDAPNEGHEVDAPSRRERGDVNALGAKVEELLLEREALQQAVRAANDQVLAKAGEISIVRANQTKAFRDHERQLSSLKELHADTIARQRAEIENIRAEREKFATENKFLQRDLAEEGRRAKQIQRSKKAGGDEVAVLNDGGARSHVNTPKKTRTLPLRDGFDDEELLLVSPSKGKEKTKVATPKLGAKRKRNAVNDSPGQSLQISQPGHDAQLEDQTLPDAPPIAAKERETIAAKTLITQEDRRFQFSQRIFNHCAQPNEKRTLEAFANFTFPSDSKITFSTLVLNQMTILSVKSNIIDFPAAVGSIMVTIWTQCMNEKYYKPMNLILDLVKFILLASSPATASLLVDDLVVLAQLTADQNAIPRFNRSKRAMVGDSKVNLEVNDDIDTNECMKILYLTACGCARHQEDIIRFWRSMRFDFISMMLRITQPIEDVHLTLKLLITSIQDETFAMIVGPDANQLSTEHHVIDRVTSMLIENPRATEDEEPYNAVEVAEMRLQALTLIEKMCSKKHSAEVFAKHTYAIGRLVRVMNDELYAIYEYKYGHELRAELVNRATRLVFHLLSVYPSLINMQEKLRVHPGGSNKYLIALTRLAFGDGVFFDRGIDDDVVDCAHQLLEDFVNPEEAEAILEAFSSAKK